MKFIYGKQDFKTLERAEENCFLMTNGLGGFSSWTMAGSNTRNDHAVLMACVQAPNRRYNMVHRLSEMLTVGTETYPISSQQFLDGSREEGYQNLKAFSYEDVPRWCYQIGGVELVKTAGMAQGANTAAVVYEIRNRGKEACCLTVTPFFQFVKKGDDLGREQIFVRKDGEVVSAGMTVYEKTTGIREAMEPVYEEYHYSYDACDGRRDHGMAYGDHRIRVEAAAGTVEYLELVYSMEPESRSGAEIVEETVRIRKELEELAGFTMPAARTLSKSAFQFIAKRESTGGDTILAGFPFFEDWGRDTMIALAGCTLAVNRVQTAKRILRTFMEHEHKGLMPNLFPEGGQEPAYNTVDASLLFINCVYLYYQKTGDQEFLKEAYPVMEKIVCWYRKGTDYGIHMDRDGLMMAGEKLDQVTWMDVRVGEILPTPRHGKPVEINAYWYNALCIMELFSGMLGKTGDFGRLAKQVKESFSREFWMEDMGCLKDVVSGTKADRQIRCNQIWAVSLPYTMLTRKQETCIVETVFEKLYTPYGLRTLAQEDEEFHPCYGGRRMDRDMAYHQGTVWTFPLGAYYLAYLRVHEYGAEALEVVKEQLEVMESALREGCIGQLPEIYDGASPSSSKGCFAQAWSVGEILRVYEAVEYGCGLRV